MWWGSQTIPANAGQSKRFLQSEQVVGSNQVSWWFEKIDNIIHAGLNMLIWWNSGILLSTGTRESTSKSFMVFWKTSFFFSTRLLGKSEGNPENFFIAEGVNFNRAFRER